MSNRITVEQQRYIVKHLTLGTSHSVIRENFAKEFQRTINPVTISRIRKKQQSAIVSGRELIAQEAVVNATMLKQKGYQLLEHKMDAAIEDMTEIRKLRKQLQNGDISEAVYKAKIDLYEQLTINELTKVTDSMHSQAKGGDEDVVTPQDQAALTALIAGIQSGNPVQLIQVVAGSQAA